MKAALVLWLLAAAAPQPPVKELPCPVDPSLRPRLVIVVEGDPKPMPCQVRELDPDPKAALAKAKAENKPLLCTVLSARSLTSRRFETAVLANPKVKAYIDAHFVETRLDADNPEHKDFLAAQGVRRCPTSILLSSDGERLAILEPFDWDAPFGLLRSAFEFEQLYTQALESVRTHPPRVGCGR